MLTIIDHKLGNVIAIEKILRRLDVKCQISASIKDIEKSEKLILPGVGHFASAMRNLIHLKECLDKKIKIDKVPIFGICLGLQLFCKTSEEGNTRGFGWIDADVKKFITSNRSLKVPHVGWNTIKMSFNSSKMFNQSIEQHYFYFTHSYYVDVYDKSVNTGTTMYGVPFTSLIEKDNIFGTQFHPEKSHEPGYKLLKRFVEL